MKENGWILNEQQPFLEVVEYRSYITWMKLLLNDNVNNKNILFYLKSQLLVPQI